MAITIILFALVLYFTNNSIIFVPLYLLYIFIDKLIRKYPSLRIQYNEKIIHYIGRELLNIPAIRELYDSKINGIKSKSQKKIQEQMSRYPKAILSIPTEGWTNKQILELINNYKNITLSLVKNKHISGTIYSNSLINNTYSLDDCPNKEKLLSYTFEVSNLWNHLHQDEFHVGNLIDYQVVNMVANMFRTEQTNDIAGTVTSGGTESLMCALRSYRNYGLREKGHRPGESVVICLNTVHAAIMKAGDAYNIKIVLVDTDIFGIVNMKKLKEVALYYDYELVAIVGSGPCYSVGIIDPIKEMAKIALKHKCGLHVDCCLGGFVVNYLDYNTNFLDIKGVTSLSADTHKNGQAPKGSSVLIGKKMSYSGKNIMEYSIYTVPDWSGGMFGSITDKGSNTCVPNFTALVSMLSIGQNEYSDIANKIQNCVIDLSKLIKNIDDFIVLNGYNINVVTWTINNKKQHKKGFMSELGYQLKHKNIIVNVLKSDVVHFCVTR